MSDPNYERQKWEHELKREDAKRAHDWRVEFFQRINNETITSGQLVFRTLLLINGGAAVSVLAFIGAIAAKDRVDFGQVKLVANALTWFAIGVAVTVAGLGLSYLTNYFTAAHSNTLTAVWEHPYFKSGPMTKLLWWFKLVFHVGAVIAALVSLGLFVFGMLDVRHAIGALQLAPT
jgi:hypothetical protein